MNRRRFILQAGAMAAAPAGPLLQDASRDMWTIGNSRVEREIRFDQSSGLTTAGWRHKVTGTEFVLPGRRPRFQEFEFAADDVRINGRATAVELLDGDFVTRDATGSGGGRELRVRLRAKQKPLEITVHYAVYGEHPAIRKWLSIRNTGSAPITLSQMCFESVAIAPGVPSQLEASGGYGASPRELFTTGRVSDTAMMVRNGTTREGYAVLNEAPGYLKRTELNRSWRPQVQVMYDTDLFPFELKLAPAQTFVTAKSSILMFADGKGQADSHWVIPAYVVDVLTLRGRSFRPPVHYNTWEPFSRDINQDRCSELIEQAARIGVDIFTIDDGWQEVYGANDVSRANFPHGLQPVRALLQKHGMGLGLWVPLATVATQTRDAKEYPEYFCRERNGKVKITGTASGEHVVMCLGSRYQELAAQRLVSLIDLSGAVYLKVDLTAVFNAYGEAPGCFAEGHYHATWAESLVRMYEGLQYVSAAVHKAHPGILLDYTFELWGEKHLIDHALLQSAEFDWLSNVIDANSDSAGPRQCRALLYPRTVSIPPDAMMIGNLRAEIGSAPEHLATAIASAPLFLGDLRDLSPEQTAWYSKGIDWYKGLRKRALLQAFFPLGSWQSPSAVAWDGYARLSRSGEGFLAVFANESAASTANIKISSFPDGEYSVVRVGAGSAAWRVRGSQIRDGWDLPINSGGTRVWLLELRRER
jgi:alpha-galactosidase